MRDTPRPQVTPAAYNDVMNHMPRSKTPLTSFFAKPLAVLLGLFLSTFLSYAAAQTGAQATAEGAGKPLSSTASRPDRAIERLHSEDAGSRIDELRVGGETQSITVQPKNNMPAYEIKPQDARNPASSGARVWNFLKF